MTKGGVMPSRITYIEGLEFGIKESSDPANFFLTALQVWNISDICHSVKYRAILIFSQMRSGLLVMLQDCNANNHLSGKEVFYSLSKYDVNSLAQQKVFIEFSFMWGILPAELSKLIFGLSRTLVE